MSAPYTAVDGARITVDEDGPSGGWAVNCTVCGYVASDDEKPYVEGVASHHEGWHEAEYEREQARR